MKLIKEKMMLYDVIVQNNKLLPVFNRFGIQLGFGDVDIETACLEMNINLHFFLEIINTFHDKNYFPKEKLIEFDVFQIVKYLKKTHLYYINFILTDFEKQLSSIKMTVKGDGTDFELLERFYNKFKAELLQHINDEDKNIFPYVLAVQKLIDKKMSSENFNKYFANNSISDFEKEHSMMEMKMTDLKSLILKYLPPLYDQNLCNKFLFSLMRFEEDLKNHARIEDKILVTKVKELEIIINGDNDGR